MSGAFAAGGTVASNGIVWTHTLEYRMRMRIAGGGNHNRTGC